ncbi:hypothetical protein LEP1GSC178_2065 [Leptospira licerasiae str. MMD4847]|uniref:Secreted protein n=1 Tax=Leptospira licerasiae str. MMD4847 TaxID=1049971 RepID=A0ABP2RKR0_9LEPT|nr:hypothetical protein LEP1GSC178_2065 [Leptospira licerasiae str. MMD4847]
MRGEFFFKNFLLPFCFSFIGVPSIRHFSRRLFYRLVRSFSGLEIFSKTRPLKEYYKFLYFERLQAESISQRNVS